MKYVKKYANLYFVKKFHNFTKQIFYPTNYGKKNYKNKKITCICKKHYFYFIPYDFTSGYDIHFLIIIG